MKEEYSILTQIEVSNPGLQYAEDDKKKNLHPNQTLGLVVPFVKEYVNMIKVRMFGKKWYIIIIEFSTINIFQAVR